MFDPVLSDKGLESPADSHLPVIPSDSDDVPVVFRAIYIGTGGDLVCIAAKNGQTATYKNLPSGTLLPVRPSRILATGTSASDLVGMW